MNGDFKRTKVDKQHFEAFKESDNAHNDSVNPSTEPTDEEGEEEKEEKEKEEWRLDSWRLKSIKQQPQYADPSKVDQALGQIKSLPPLVYPGEIDKLREELAEAAEGKAFLLQGGDCAELFQYCNKEHIETNMKILLQMSLILIWGASTKVVRVARMAGQYGKPRSNPLESVNGVEYPSYRGDNVNGYSLKDREHDPNRLVQAYFHSAATLNYIRALVAGDFTDLCHPEKWEIAHVKQNDKYSTYVKQWQHSLESTSMIDSNQQKSKGADFFVSHEGLILGYEEALTAKFGSRYYNVGAHFLWIGDRTRQIDHAHVEYFRGISNPIGVKIGPSADANELVELIKRLNPENVPGKVTLITRYGCDKIRAILPIHLRAVLNAGLIVVWCCDPMHGNTESTTTGVKTRNFNKILREMQESFAIHREFDRKLNGVHFELTGDNVTECTGGDAVHISENDLSKNYQTFCDPRLNYQQSLDMAFHIVDNYHQSSPVTRS